MKVRMIANIFTTGTMSPTAIVWPEQWIFNFNLNKQAKMKNDFYISNNYLDLVKLSVLKDQIEKNVLP
jgi:hypothetical protein